MPDVDIDKIVGNQRKKKRCNSGESHPLKPRIRDGCVGCNRSSVRRDGGGHRIKVSGQPPGTALPAEPTQGKSPKASGLSKHAERRTGSRSVESPVRLQQATVAPLVEKS